MPRNDFEGDYKCVLCVCSAGLLRSPTAALVLSQPPFEFNTRSVGTGDYALTRITMSLLNWPDEIVCMEQEHKTILMATLEKYNVQKPVICLDIPDDYSYRDPVLMKLIAQRYTERVNQP